MKLSFKTAVSGVAAAALAGGILMVGATSAFAATAPTFEPDPASIGSVTFYNAAGAPVTTGSVSDAPFAAYYAASGGGISPGDNKAFASFYTPTDNAPTVTWSGTTATTAQAFPPATAYPGSLAGNTNAVVAGSTSSSKTLATFISSFPNASAKDPGIYQVRIFTTQAGSGGSDTYYSTDIKVTGTTWTQVFPVPVTATATSLTVSPNPSTVGDTVTLTATESPASAGSVQFKDGTTNVGSPAAVNGSGVATTTTSTLTQGSHSLTAVFTPTDASFSGSTSPAVSTTVNPQATPTSTTLAVTGGYQAAGSAATLTATVTGPGSAPNGAGTVAFYDNGSATPIPGAVTQSPAGTFSINLASGFTAGNHSVVAKFTPTDVTQFRVSQSAPQAFVTQAPLGSPCAPVANNPTPCSDVQNIQATVPVGTLLINTPYTAAAPLDLGNLTLSSDSSTYIGVTQFSGIKVTDTRAGNLPWTVQAQSSNLTDGHTNTNSVINSQNVGLTALAVDSVGAGFTGTPGFTDNPAANGVAPNATGTMGLGGGIVHTVATQGHGLGTVTMHGTLTLIAPSSTEPGTFGGTITFTVG